MKIVCRFGALAVAALLAAGPAFAQGTTGAIEGKVSDDQGLALPGANVTAHRPSTGFTRSTVTDAGGIFRLPGLLVGAYNVKVELAGFATSVRAGHRQRGRDHDPGRPSEGRRPDGADHGHGRDPDHRLDRHRRRRDHHRRTRSRTCR